MEPSITVQTAGAGNVGVTMLLSYRGSTATVLTLSPSK